MKTEIVSAENSLSRGMNGGSLSDSATSRKSPIVSGNAYMMGKSQSVLFRDEDPMPSQEIEWFESSHPLPEDLHDYSKEDLLKMTDKLLTRYRSSNADENKIDSLASTLSDVKTRSGRITKGDLVTTCANLLLAARNEPTATIDHVVLSGRSFSVQIYGSTRGAAEIRISSSNKLNANLCVDHHRSGVIVLTRDKISRLNLPQPPSDVEADFVDSFFEDVQTGLSDTEVKQNWVNWFMEWAYRIEVEDDIDADGGRSSALIVRVAPLRVPTQLKDFKWKLSKSRTAHRSDGASASSGEQAQPDMRQIAVFFRDTGARIALRK